MTVTLGVVAYNEEKSLPRLLKDIQAQDYPAEQMEILLVDSGSDDGTKAVMDQFAADNPQYIRVVVADNPKRKQAAGWNVVLSLFQEDVVIRIDAHARIPSDFVRKNMECLEDGEYVSGGPRMNLPEEETPWQEMLLGVEQSMFGSGIAAFRGKKQKEEKRKYVNSMFHAAYRREVFEKAGMFDERLGRTEDNELHYRIRKNGFRLCYDPSIRSWQYIRSSLPGMMKQKYENGYWIALTTKVCPQCLSLYHFVPFAFVMAVIGSAVLAIRGNKKPAGLLGGVYTGAAVLMSASAVKGTKKHLCQLFMPLVFFLMHMSYGIGSLIGFLKAPFWKTEESEKTEKNS